MRSPEHNAADYRVFQCDHCGKVSHAWLPAALPAYWEIDIKGIVRCDSCQEAAADAWNPSV